MAGTSATAPTVTDFQGTAGQNIANTGAQALHDIAQNGQKGQAAIAQAAQASAAARTGALQNAMAYAVLRGAPSGNVGQNQATIAQPYDQRAAVLGLMGQNYKDNTDAMTQANQNFTAGAKAGLPVAQTALDRTISNNQSANAAKRDAQQAAMQMKQMELQSSLQSHDLSNQLVQMRMQALQDKANKPASALGVNQIIDRSLGGPQNGGAVIDNGANKYLQALAAAEPDISPGASTDPNAMGPALGSPLGAGRNDALRGQYYDNIDSSLGLPSGTSANLAHEYGTKSTSQQNANASSSDALIRSSDQYKTGMTKIDQLMQNATTPAARQSAVNALYTDVGPDVARVVLGDYSVMNKVVTGP